MSNIYPQKGMLSVAPAADFASKTSAVNLRSDARMGSDGVGKRTGMQMLRDNGDGTFDLMIAQGPLDTDKWSAYVHGTAITPA